MAKTSRYCNYEPSCDGSFNPKIDAKVNVLLDLYCKHKGVNKTRKVNDILWEFLKGEFETALEA